jgi:hypothetical protein
MSQLAHSPPPAEPASRRSQKYLAVFAASGLASAVLALWFSTGAAERDALVRLPEPQRRALYERTRHTLESTCDGASRPSGLEDFCREQAEFARKFPECDAACQARSQRYLAAPSR